MCYFFILFSSVLAVARTIAEKSNFGGSALISCTGFSIGFSALTLNNPVPFKEIGVETISGSFFTGVMSILKIFQLNFEHFLEYVYIETKTTVMRLDKYLIMIPHNRGIT